MAGVTKSHIFSVVIEPDEFPNGDEAFHAYCPSLKGCHTYGTTSQQALERIQEAVELYVDVLTTQGKSIPVDPENGAVEWPTPSVVVNL